MRAILLHLVDTVLLTAASAGVLILVTGGGVFFILEHRVSAHHATSLLWGLLVLGVPRFAVLPDSGFFGLSSLRGREIAARCRHLCRMVYDRLDGISARSAGRIVVGILLVSFVIKALNAWFFYGVYSGDDVEVHEMSLAHLLDWSGYRARSLRSPFHPMAFIHPAQRLAYELDVRDEAVLVFAGRMVVVAISSLTLLVVYHAARPAMARFRLRSSRRLSWRAASCTRRSEHRFYLGPSRRSSAFSRSGSSPPKCVLPPRSRAASGVGETGPVRFVSSFPPVLDAGMEHYCDRVAYRIYTERWLDRLAGLTDLPVWITESGTAGIENHFEWTTSTFDAIRRVISRRDETRAAGSMAPSPVDSLRPSGYGRAMKTPAPLLLSLATLVPTVSAHAAGSIEEAQVSSRPRIAVFSGATATIHNSEPLVTSNQARARHELPPLTRDDGTPLRFDHLVPQRLAAPVEVYIEQFSAHPLERDAAELYGPPDGYLDRDGAFHESRQSPDDTPVYRATLRPEDGLYLLPYMALQVDGSAWNGNCARPGAPPAECRQPFYPDASRLFEEIDRSLGGRDSDGLGNMLSTRADFDFYRALPPGGYKKGLPASERTDVGEGEIPPETIGVDFFPYAPAHFRQWTRVQDLARVTNTVQEALDEGLYDGAIWLEGSPSVEETVYWLSLLIDTEVPIAGNAAQRPHGALSADGDRNIVDSVDYILSSAWADENGRNDLGAVVIEDEQIFASRQVQKTDARPGGYRATGDHGGILGTIGKPGPVVIWFRPTTRHTWKSAVRLTELPDTVSGVRAEGGRLTRVEVAVKDDEGRLRGDAIPKMTMLKVARYQEDASAAHPADEVDVLARIEKNLEERPLAGFVLESLAPFAGLAPGMGKALRRAAFSGMPTVRVGRGDAGGLTATDPSDIAIEGSNLTATKARLLLKACLLKLGSLPIAADPESPTPAERQAVVDAIARYQEIFDTH